MAAPVPADSDVSSGTYACTSCGYQIDVGSTQHLPPCPQCSNGDSRDDPYPAASNLAAAKLANAREDSEDTSRSGGLLRCDGRLAGVAPTELRSCVRKEA